MQRPAIGLVSMKSLQRACVLHQLLDAGVRAERPAHLAGGPNPRQAGRGGAAQRGRQHRQHLGGIEAATGEEGGALVRQGEPAAGHRHPGVNPDCPQRLHDRRRRALIVHVEAELVVAEALAQKVSHRGQLLPVAVIDEGHML